MRVPRCPQTGVAGVFGDEETYINLRQRPLTPALEDFRSIPVLKETVPILDATLKTSL